MMRTFVLSFCLVALAFALPAGANPCNPGCGEVAAEPFTSSSTAEGTSSLLLPTWEHCHYTQYPHTTTCVTSTGPAYAGTVTGPSAACAKGVLKANGVVVAASLWVC